MANCDNLICIPKACFDSNVGSFTRIALLDLTDVDLSTVVINSGGTIVSATTTADFVEFSIPSKGNQSAVETKATDLALGGGLFEQTITVTIPYRKAETRNAITLAASGNRDMWLAVYDGNEQWWLYGLKAGVNLMTTESNAGEARATGSHYVLTFMGQEAVMAYPISASLIEIEACS